MLRLPPLLLLAVAAYLASTAEAFTLSDFPYSRCTRTSGSPYSLQLSLREKYTGGEKVCYRIGERRQCDGLSGNNLRCCARLVANLYKITIETSLACKGAISNVTVRGRPRSFLFEDGLGPSALFRITGLKWGAASAIGSEVCFHTGGACPNLDVLSPWTGEPRYALHTKDVPSDEPRCCALGRLAPQTVAPKSNFPYARCLRSTTNNPYQLSLVSRTKVTGGETACYRVTGQRECDGLTGTDLTCCERLETDFQRLLIEASPNCTRSIKAVTLKGRSKPFFYITNLGPTAVFKIANLKYTEARAIGATMCITLGGKCPSVETLFPWASSVRYSMLSGDSSKLGTCCSINKARFDVISPPRRLAL